MYNGSVTALLSIRLTSEIINSPSNRWGIDGVGLNLQPFHNFIPYSCSSSLSFFLRSRQKEATANLSVASKHPSFADMFAMKPTEASPSGQVVKVGIVESVAIDGEYPISKSNAMCSQMRHGHSSRPHSHLEIVVGCTSSRSRTSAMSPPMR